MHFFGRKLRRTSSSKKITFLLAAAVIALGSSVSATAGTPTLIQHVASSANPIGVGIEGNNFKIPLPNSVGSGNAIILGMTYPHGSSPTITDSNGNTWPTTAAVSADAGSGGNISSIFVLPNASAGLTTITVSFASPIIPFNYVVSEFNNVATTSPINGTRATADDAGPSLTTGSFTPGNNDASGGNLIWNYYAVSGGANGNPTSWVAGSNFTLLDADIAWANKQGFPHASQYFVQTTAAPINPSIIATGDSADGYNAVAVALKAASAGTAASAGIHINTIIHQTSTSWPASGTLTMQFPTTGTLRVLEYSNEAVGVTSVTDSDGGTWTRCSRKRCTWHMVVGKPIGKPERGRHVPYIGRSRGYTICSISRYLGCCYKPVRCVCEHSGCQCLSTNYRQQHSNYNPDDRKWLSDCWYGTRRRSGSWTHYRRTSYRNFRPHDLLRRN